MGTERPYSGRAARWAKFLLPALLILFCVALYLVSASDGDTEQAAAPKDGAPTAKTGTLAPAAEFMERAWDNGLAQCERESADATGIEYSVSNGESSARLTLGLENGCVESFTISVELPAKREEDSRVLERLYEEDTRVAAGWALSCAEALLIALDYGSELSQTDREAFLLAIDSTIIDKKQHDGTASGFEYDIRVLPGSPADALHISVHAPEGKN